MSAAGPALAERDHDLASLVTALAHPPATALVEGEPGIGKSRLVRQALADPALAGRQHLTGCARPALTACPLGPVIEALATATGPPRRRLSPLCGALRPVLPDLADMLPPAPPPLPDPPLARHRLVRATAELLSKLGPATLVLENLQWADEATAELLQLVSARRPAELSVAVTCTPAAGLPAAAAATTCVRLAPLSPPAAARLASEILGEPGAVLPGELADLLYQRHGGVPAVVREDVRSLRARGLLRRAGGGWAAEPGALLSAPVPPAVGAEVVTRADSAGVRAILEAAAVLARPVDPELVGTLAAAGPAETSAALAAAARCGLLRGHGPDGPVTFRHELTRLAIYRAMCGDRRRSLHALAARELASRDTATALAHFKLAGDRLGWAVFDQAPSQPGARRQLTHALLGLSDAALHLGHYPLSLQLAQRAERLATGLETHDFGQHLPVAILRARYATSEISFKHVLNGQGGAPPRQLRTRLLWAQLRAGQGKPDAARQTLTAVADEACAAGELAIAAQAAAELSRVAVSTSQRCLAAAHARQVLDALAAAQEEIWAAPLLPFAPLDLVREVLPRYRRSLAGRDAPLARAALGFAEARVSEDGGAAALAPDGYRRARLAYASLPDPRMAAHAGVLQVRAQLSAGQSPDTDLLRQAWRTFTALGAAWDLSRLKPLMRLAGLPVPHRRGRPGYGNQLSPREREIADLAAAGHTNRDIAVKLYLSDCTVKYHLGNAMRKLEITSRRQLRDVLEPTASPNGPVVVTSLRDHICRCARCGRELTHPPRTGYPEKNSPILAENPLVKEEPA
jgi:DNA-binding CsgD family transcriptional regulator